MWQLLCAVYFSDDMCELVFVLCRHLSVVCALCSCLLLIFLLCISCCVLIMKRSRVYKSGSQKRSEKREKVAKSVENTNRLTSYFSSSSSVAADSTDNDASSEVDSCFDNNNTCDVDSLKDNEVGDDGIPRTETDDSAASTSTTNTNNQFEQTILDLQNEFPTDRGILPGDVFDSDLKRAILQHGPCKPTSETHFTNPDGKPNFKAAFYHRTDDSITIPRQWLCYSPTLNRPYCEVCWLFADRNYNQFTRAWIDGVQGDNHNMTSKIIKHEESAQDFHAARAFGQWVSGKTIDAETEKQRKSNVSFWTKVLQRLVAIILTLSTLNLAFRAHRETVGKGVCEGGGFPWISCVGRSI